MTGIMGGPCQHCQIRKDNMLGLCQNCGKFPTMIEVCHICGAKSFTIIDSICVVCRTNSRQPVILAVMTAHFGPTYFGTLTDYGTLIDWWGIEPVNLVHELGGTWSSMQLVSGTEQPLQLDELDIEAQAIIPQGYEVTMRQDRLVPLLEEWLTAPESPWRGEEIDVLLETARSGRFTYNGWPGTYSVYSKWAAYMHMTLRLPFPLRYFLQSRLFDFVVNEGWTVHKIVPVAVGHI